MDCFTSRDVKQLRRGGRRWLRAGPFAVMCGRGKLATVAQTGLGVGPNRFVAHHRPSGRRKFIDEVAVNGLRCSFCRCRDCWCCGHCRYWKKMMLVVASFAIRSEMCDILRTRSNAARTSIDLTASILSQTSSIISQRFLEPIRT